MWYIKDKIYKYGDYDSDKKKYYNEDSGKWVSRLNKKVIEEKYIRYEFSYWDDRQIEKEFGYGLVERIGRFLFLLYKKGIEIEKRKGNRWVYVDSSVICCGILSSGYIEIIKKLKSLGIIDIKYGLGKFGKEKKIYKLNDGFFSENCERRIIYIRNTKLNRFLDKLFSGDLDVGDKRDEFIKWEIESCKKIDLIDYNNEVENLLKIRLEKRIKEDGNKIKWDFLSKKKKENINNFWDNERKKNYLFRGNMVFNLLNVELDEIKRGGFSFNGFDSDSFSGRISNIINSKEKEFRSLVKLDKENVVEVDMVNGYISLFYRILKGLKYIKRGESKFDDKIKEIVKDVNVDDFLNKYEICFEGNEKIDFYKFLGINLGVFDENIGFENRIYIKELVLYLINGERNDGMRKKYLNDKYNYDEIMEMIFCKGGLKVIDIIKNSEIDFKLKGRNYYGYEKFKNMSRILMSMEVIIMKGIWGKMIINNIYYISIFDGMLVRGSDINYINEIIKSELVGINSCISFKNK